MLYYLPTYLPLPPTSTSTNICRMSEMQNSAFLRRGKFGMLFFFLGRCFFFWLMFLICIRLLLATLWQRLIFFCCCCPASASASDDLNVLPVLYFVFSCYFVLCGFTLLLLALSARI